MKKRLLIWILGICLLFAACAKKDDAAPAPFADAAGQTEENGLEDKTKQPESQSAQKPKDKAETATKPEPEEEPSQEPQEPEVSVEEDPNAPEVTFVDYSQDIQMEGSGQLLLSVMENCPVISFAENEAAAEKMNMVFEQQHASNQAYIEEDKKAAQSAYEDLPEEEKDSWTGYGYGATYKLLYSSAKILSIACDNYEWQGTPHPNTWRSSYCFDVPTGKLLTLADIFTDKAKAGGIVDQHILDTITADPYKDYLMEGYEDYVSDILREDVFYLNDKGVVVVCNPYMVTGHAGGIIEVEVPYEALKEVLNEAYMPKE